MIASLNFIFNKVKMVFRKIHGCPDRRTSVRAGSVREGSVRADSVRTGSVREDSVRAGSVHVKHARKMPHWRYLPGSMFKNFPD